MIVERDNELGGILQQCIHNGFGLKYFKAELTGPEYSQRFIDQLKDTNIQVFLNSMVINLTPDHFITAINPNLGIIKIQAKSIVIAMGCRERTRGAINIPGMRPAGIFPAGQAQRFMNMEGYFPGKRILILRIRRYRNDNGSPVYVRRITSFGRGRNFALCFWINQKSSSMLKEFDIPLYLKHTIVDIQGKDRVEGATIAEVDDKWAAIPGTEIQFDCDTILFSVGLIPENEVSLKAGCQLSINGGPLVNEFCETNLAGIFACGNVLQVHDLVDWVSLESERAGTGAAQLAKGELITHDGESRTIKPGNNVGYIKPERIDNFTEAKKVEISFRVKGPKQNQRIELVSNDQVIYSKKSKFVIPSEMIILKPELKPDEIGEDIVVNVLDDEVNQCE